MAGAYDLKAPRHAPAQSVVLYWTLPDWSFFIDHLTRAHMRYPGRICLELNKRVTPDGAREPFTEVIEACRAAGGAVAPPGDILFAVEGPLALIA